MNFSQNNKMAGAKFFIVIAILLSSIAVFAMGTTAHKKEKKTIEESISDKSVASNLSHTIPLNAITMP